MHDRCGLRDAVPRVQRVRLLPELGREPVHGVRRLGSPPTEGDDWNTAGPVVAPGDGAAAAAAKAAAGMDKTSPSSTTGVGPCVKNPDGGMDC